MKIVVLDSLFDSLEVEAQAAASQGATVERWTGEPAALRQADIVAHVRTPVDARLIAAMERCRVITRFGTGVDTVDIHAAEAAGIAVVTVRDYCIPELCSHTLALAFALTRRLLETTGDPNTNWQTIAATTPLIRYETAAVIGMGSIGTRIAAALKTFGYDVVAVTHTPARAETIGVPVAKLEQALAQANIIFLHCALDRTTRHLINEPRLGLLREGALLINTARLGLLDEEAVAHALEQRRLGGLALDAYLESNSPLRGLIADPRLLVTPHLGWYSNGSASALRRSAILDALKRAGNHSQMEVPTT